VAFLHLPELQGDAEHLGREREFICCPEPRHPRVSLVGEGQCKAIPLPRVSR